MLRQLIEQLRRLSAPPAPLRAGVLDTGELVLVDGLGHAQIFSSSATRTIGDVISAAWATRSLAPEQRA